jgi:oligoribonuclease NrnB/cAMP/cGMP phosphodiesterase (DHH superfamily)
VSDRTLFIYHKDCFDGFTAAWIFSRFKERDAEFWPARYGDLLPHYDKADGSPKTPIDGRDVVIADFSYQRKDMFEIATRAKSFTVLDHHKTAEAALDGLDKQVLVETGREIAVVFDMERSGAGIVWDYYSDRRGTCEVCGASRGHQPGCEFARRPLLVEQVEGRDLWRTDKFSPVYMANVYAAPMTFEAWDQLNECPPSIMIERGRAILQYIEQYGTKGLAEARVRKLRTPATHMWDIEPPWTVNMPYMNCSDYLSRLMAEKGTDFVMGYFCRNDGRWQFSLRSRNGFNCSVIAKAFGGGGHKEASGFDVATLAEVFVE